jgi:hypothetical protein
MRTDNWRGPTIADFPLNVSRLAGQISQSHLDEVIKQEDELGEH